MFQEDMQALTALVSQMVMQVMSTLQASQAAASTPDQSAHRERIDERHYRKMSMFTGITWKDMSFQFRSATKSSSTNAHKLLEWAERQSGDIEGFSKFSAQDSELAQRLSGQLFNVISTMTLGEPLQLLRERRDLGHISNYNGAEAWRGLAKRYSPRAPLRAMRLMMQVIGPEKAKNVKDIRSIIEKRESRVLMLQRDFDQKLSSNIKGSHLSADSSQRPSGISDPTGRQVRGVPAHH